MHACKGCVVVGGLQDEVGLLFVQFPEEFGWIACPDLPRRDYFLGRQGGSSGKDRPFLNLETYPGFLICIVWQLCWQGSSMPAAVAEVY